MTSSLAGSEDPVSSRAFLSGGGETAAIIAGFDWSKTPLGPLEQWSQAMKATCNLILHSPVPMVTLWGDDGIMIYNDAYAVVAGGRHPALFGSKVREGWPEVAEFNDHVMKTCLAGRTLAYRDQELTLRRHAGEPEQVWMDLDYSPLMDEAGRPAGVIAIVVETTDKVRAEQQLRAGERRRVALIELTDQFRNSADPGDIAFAAARMLAAVMHVSRAGYGRIDTLRETLLIERDWNAPEVESLAGTLHLRDFGSYVDNLKRGETVVVADADADPRTVSHAAALKVISATAFINIPITERGVPVAVLYLNNAGARHWLPEEISFIRDVAERTRVASERRRAEQALRQLAGELEQQVMERTAELDRIWRNARDLLVVLNEEGDIRSVNPAWTTALGYSPRESLGEDLHHFAFVADEVKLAIHDIRADRIPFFIDRQLCFRHKDGSERWIDWRITTEGRLLFAYGRDVTAEREQKNQLFRAGEQLRHAQKMEAIGQLTGGVAHDFNNLLQVISGSLQSLTPEVAGNARAENHLQRALAGVRRGANLSNQLLAFGRRQALEPKVINIARFIDTLEEMLHRTIGEAIEIHVVRAADLWTTLIDPSQIENALLNLALNARDAMSGIGKLTIELANIEVEAAEAGPEMDLAAGHYVMLAVSDTGVGMPPETLARAFEPFFSTKPVGKGSGLGLSMVYGFVKQSGGHVRIDSLPGEGTTIRIYLPRSKAEEDRLAEAGPGPISGGTETILIAEDDDEVRATVVEMLSELGYRVLAAGDAASALEVVESGAPVDLLFTDVVMPGPLRSADLARRARQRLPDLAVLFTSGYTENSIVHDGRLDAGVELLSKPYSREALARRIRQVLSGRPRREPAETERQATLPDRLAARGPAAEDVAMAEAAEATALRILVVEDDFLIRLNTLDILEDLGHRPAGAASAEDALKLFETGDFDILLTDMGLPQMSGTELARTLRGRSPGIGVIFATGNDLLPDVPGLRPPVLLQKPFDSQDIAEALVTALVAAR